MRNIYLQLNDNLHTVSRISDLIEFYVGHRDDNDDAPWDEPSAHSQLIWNLNLVYASRGHMTAQYNSFDVLMEDLTKIKDKLKVI